MKKLLLAFIGLAFAISSCNDQGRKCRGTYQEQCSDGEKGEQRQRRW